MGIRTASILVNVAGNLLALAHFGAGVDGIFMAGIWSSLTSLVLLLPVIKEDFTFRFDKKLFKAMFAFSWPFIPAGAASIMVNVIDKPLLSHLAGLSEECIRLKPRNFVLIIVGIRKARPKNSQLAAAAK